MGFQKEEKLSEQAFENPPAEYRGAPFWAWNTDLDEKELLWQIEQLKEMGFGGFFMHTRAGMSTEYLGKDFMRLIRACNEKARKMGMFSYLYDEDRWPSGAAGGYVTENKSFRQQTIVLSMTPPEEMSSRHLDDERDPILLCAYDIQFDEVGKLKKYTVVNEDAAAAGEKWYAYRLLVEKSGWYNGYTYLDTMNPEAVKKFIEVTYEAYYRELGGEFGKSVPAIFTDEPAYYSISFKGFARDGKDAAFPWTTPFRTAFEKNYGYDIVAKMPEVVWDRSDGAPNTERYRFFRIATELFSTNYSDAIGKWCSDHHIAFTGHFVEEPMLLTQMHAIGEAMRQYRNMGIPGIDMLCDCKEFTTAKQAQSVVHQYGKRGMTCEIYGVTGWEFDFRGHKFEGDWLAALGTTLRVPHLSWVSMRGSAKRDYPASIGYQSSWYRQYGYIEDHFARLNTALTRGKPVVDVAVLHPIESAWMTAGVKEYTALSSDTLETQFQNVTEWLLRGQIDFDFFSESLLPELYRESEEGFCLGEMNYKAVLVPPVVTIRRDTLRALSKFVAHGGKLVVCEECPKTVDGVPCGDAQTLWKQAERVNFSQSEILNALKFVREVAIYSQNGNLRKDLFYQLRRDGENEWLFIAHCDMASRLEGNDCAFDRLRIEVKGIFGATLYDTLHGTHAKAEFYHENGNTVIIAPCYPLDSFLYLLTAGEEETVAANETEKVHTFAVNVDVPDFVSFTHSEPNVMVLDMAEWSRNGKDFMPREEMLRIDMCVRQELHYPIANGADVQPWRLPAQKPTQSVWLRFFVQSETEAQCSLGYEYAEEVSLNGERVSVCPNGYFVDKAIHTMPLPPLKRGENELIVRVPISERVSLENLFLIGEFGVRTVGAFAKITPPVEKITFDSFQKQDFPFYGANITYVIPFSCEAGDLTVTADYYIGALIGVKLDGKEVGKIVLPPYELTVDGVTAGKHVLELTLYGTRINTFGALHLTTPMHWKSPDMWYTGNNMWSYEYNLQDMGILKKPVLTLKKRN